MYWVYVGDSVGHAWKSFKDKIEAESYGYYLSDYKVIDDAHDSIIDDFIDKAVSLYESKKKKHIVI